MSEQTVSKILIADTNPRILQILNDKFIDSGFQTETMDCAKEIVISATLENPCAIISNISLPDSPDGNKLLNMLNSIPGKENIPIIFITSSSETTVSQSGTRVLEFIKKPYVFEELLKKVQTTVRKSEGKKKSSIKQTVKKQKGLELVEIIQVLASNRKTCTIELAKKEQKGKIILSGGKIISALTSTLSGENAFFEMFTWIGADFFIADNPSKNIETTISTDMNSLMLEGLRRADEEENNS